MHQPSPRGRSTPLSCCLLDNETPDADLRKTMPCHTAPIGHLWRSRKQIAFGACNLGDVQSSHRFWRIEGVEREGRPGVAGCRLQIAVCSIDYLVGIGIDHGQTVAFSANRWYRRRYQHTCDEKMQRPKSSLWILHGLFRCLPNKDSALRQEPALGDVPCQAAP